jgi:hypothetical protein
LHRRISIRGHFLELPYRSLRFNLIWFLHSDSPFSRPKENCSQPIKALSGESLLPTIYRAFPTNGPRQTFQLQYRWNPCGNLQ